jgi:hypothetical protein
VLVNSPDAPRSADDIEITPEMIEAGVAELSSYWRGSSYPADCVEDIYRAMARAKGQVGASALTAPSNLPAASSRK